MNAPLGDTAALDGGGLASGADFLSAVLAETGLGGLHGVAEKLRTAGFARQVDSWLGGGSNLPIAPDELRSALGEEALREVAFAFGLPVEATLKILADQLPRAIDRASPDGTLHLE